MNADRNDPERIASAEAPLPDPAWKSLFSLAGVCVVVHLLLYRRFGFHADELYFIECARHLAFGYVDHPPMIPWLVALSTSLFGENMFAMRLFPALSVAATIVLTGLMAREFGGSRFAQFIAGLTVLIVPAYLRSGSIFCIPVFELFTWTGLSLCFVKILNNRNENWWWAIGAFVGLGLMTKYTMVVWAGALTLGLLLSPARRCLKSARPWLAVLLAFALFAPHLMWEVANGWPSLEFLRMLRSEILSSLTRTGFLFNQVVNIHVLSVPICGLGLYFLFFTHDKRYWTCGWAFLIAFTFFFVNVAKPYYLAPAYTVLLAAGAVQLVSILGRWHDSPLPRYAVVAALTVGGIINGVFALPVLPLETMDRIISTVFGSSVPEGDLTREFHSQQGWEVYAEKVAQAFHDLPSVDQAVCTILMLKYQQASAVNVLGEGLPRAVSGHMNYYMWGPDPGRGEVAIAAGFKVDRLREYYEHVEQVDQTYHPLARNEFNNRPIFVCRGPKQALASVWPDFKRFYHTSEAWKDIAPVR